MRFTKEQHFNMNHLELQTKHNDISYKIEKCKDTEKKLSQDRNDAYLRMAALQSRIEEIDLLRSKSLMEEAKLEKELDELNSIEANFYPGAVFKHPTRACNPFLLAAVTYEDTNRGVEMYQLLGIGVQCNSDSFFNKIHTKEECIKYLSDRGMRFDKNINGEIKDLVKN